MGIDGMHRERPRRKPFCAAKAQLSGDDGVNDLYFRLLMGHMVGDYLLQSTMMATTKGQSSTWRGWAWCVLHCALYTGAVLTCLWRFSWPLAGLVFASHFFIDKFGLADKWGVLIGGRTFAKAVEAMQPMSEKGVLTAAFTCIVYVVTDNTMHLLLMWAALSFLGIM